MFRFVVAGLTLLGCSAGPLGKARVRDASACAAARRGVATGEQRIRDGELIAALDLAAAVDAACGAGGGPLRDRALAALGLDGDTRDAIATVDATRTEIARLEGQRRFGAALRARYRELDAAQARADRGVRAAGLVAELDVPDASRHAWLAALLAADAGDVTTARATLAGIPPGDRRPAIDVTGALLAPQPAEAHRLASRAAFAIEHATHARLTAAHHAPLDGDRPRTAASRDRRLLASYGDGVELARTDTGEAIGGFAARERVTAVAFSPGARLLAAGDATGALEIREVETLHALATIALGHAPDHLVFGDRGRVVVVGEDGVLLVADVAAGTVKQIAVATAPVIGPPAFASDLVVLPTRAGLEAHGLDGALRWKVPGAEVVVAESARFATREHGGDTAELLALDPAHGLVGDPVALPVGSIEYVDDQGVIGKSGLVWLRVTRTGEQTVIADERHELRFGMDRSRRVGMRANLYHLLDRLDPRDLHVLGPVPTRSTLQYLDDALVAVGQRWPLAGGAPTPCAQGFDELVPMGDRVAVEVLGKGWDVVDPRRCEVTGALALSPGDHLVAAWPDGRDLVVRSLDHGLQIVHAGSEARISLEVDSFKATIQRDGTLLALSCCDATVFARDGTVVAKAKIDGDPIADPLGVGIWIAHGGMLRHRPDVAMDTVDAELALDASGYQIVPAARARRFAVFDDGKLTVVGADVRASIVRPGIDGFALSPDGETIAIPHGTEAVELLDVATTTTAGWLVARGADRWLRIDGPRVTGSPIAIGEPSTLVWRAGGLELPGWVVPMMHGEITP